MKLSQCAKLTEGTLVGNDADFQSITVLTVFENEIRPGSLVIDKNDDIKNNSQLASLIDKANVTAILSREHTGLNVPHILLKPDTHEHEFSFCVGELAFSWRRQFKIPAIGVAGSSGKTTTTALLNHLLADDYKLLPNPKAEFSLNGMSGLPALVCGLTAEHEAAVLETESYGVECMKIIMEVLMPNVGIITNVTLEGNNDFTLNELSEQKTVLFSKLPKNGIAIYNADDACASKWKKVAGSRPTLTFGIHKPADLKAKNITLDQRGCPAFDLCGEDTSIHLKVNLMGYHNVYNASAACVGALVMGVTPEKIQQRIRTFNPVGRRLTPYRAVNGATIIEDCFNANPQAVKAAIDVLALQQGEKILVLADISTEYKKREIEWHEKIGSIAKAAGVDKFYGFGPLCLHTVKSFGENAYHFTDVEVLLETLQKDIKPESVVLVKGANGYAMHQVTTGLIKNRMESFISWDE